MHRKLSWAGPSCRKRKFITDSSWDRGSLTFGHRYLIVDYDRNNFSVSQAVFPDTNVPQQLVTILPPSEKGLAKGAIIGVVVGALVFIALIAGLLYLTRRKWMPGTRNENITTWEPVETKPELGAAPAGIVLGTAAVEAESTPSYPQEMFNPAIRQPEHQGNSRHPAELEDRSRNGAAELEANPSRGSN